MFFVFRRPLPSLSLIAPFWRRIPQIPPTQNTQKFIREFSQKSQHTNPQRNPHSLPTPPKPRPSQSPSPSPSSSPLISFSSPLIVYEEPSNALYFRGLFKVSLLGSLFFMGILRLHAVLPEAIDWFTAPLGIGAMGAMTGGIHLAATHRVRSVGFYSLTEREMPKKSFLSAYRDSNGNEDSLRVVFVVYEGDGIRRRIDVHPSSVDFTSISGFSADKGDSWNVRVSGDKFPLQISKEGIVTDSLLFRKVVGPFTKIE